MEAKSLMPVIKDPTKKIRNYIYHVYGHWNRRIKTDDGFKLIVYNVKGEQHTQFFDLKKYPWETTSLADKRSFQKKVNTMKALLKKEMQATHDDLNINLPDWGRKPDQKGAGS